MTTETTAGVYRLTATSPTGEAYNVVYPTLRERAIVLGNLRTAGWSRITLHEHECPQPPADDHEHCPLHGCVQYVCCKPTRA